ncbi:MAG: HypC/HybG/HupF family hydrogenase formation chaperone [Promethearchaeota archaeon]
MCLAIPGKILSLEDEHHAMADFAGTQKKVVVALLPKIQVGEYVIVHAGYAIERISHEAAQESLATWKEMISEGLVAKEDYV